jgi:AraC-like DNA-binding protein
MKHNGWHERQWQRIEEEYGEPARDVVNVMHWEMAQPLCLVAAILYISETTLRLWCRRWELMTRSSGWQKAQVDGAVRQRAKAMGFESVQQAISHLRGLGMRWIDIQRKLGCSASTVSRNFHESLKGDYALTAEGRQVKSDTRRRLNAEGQRGRWKPLITNPKKYYAAVERNERNRTETI